MNVQARVDFGTVLRVWDGFGVNYVETCQTRDYAASPQDYGGFSTLPQEGRSGICDKVFGGDGLRPGVVKLFLDPFHQNESPWKGERIDQGDYDHATTTRWQREFVCSGLEQSCRRGERLKVLVGMYGPPSWMTVQKQVRARDLAPVHRDAYAKYLVAYADWLLREHKVPVYAVSIHNEGECWPRWNDDGRDPPDGSTHDYNCYFSPEAVADMIPRVRRMLDANGLHHVLVSPGETYSWTRFHQWGYADAIADDAGAVQALGLVTSHGFAFGSRGRWYGDWRNKGLEIIAGRKKEPIPAWVTSHSFGAMNADFAWELYQHIYCADASAVIPWACVQYPRLWAGDDPNPGTAFRVDGQGGYTVEPGYYVYKQVTRAGQPETGVARTRCNDSDIALMGFSSCATPHPDAFVLINRNEHGESRTIDIELVGSTASSWEVFRTSDSERYSGLGKVASAAGTVTFEAVPNSVTTFFAC